MKKASLLSFFCAMSIILGGCSLGSSNAAGEDEVIHIRFGHGAAETNARHTAVMEFKKIVEEKSDNKIEVSVFPGEQLGTEAQMVESVSLNDLQMVAAATFAQYEKRMGLFEMPFLFDSYEQAWAVMDGSVAEKISAPLVDHNLRIVGYFENGFRHITSNYPIEKPEDLQGLKIRTPEAPISISTFQAMGASPTPMAFGELYMALQQGTVDAQENPVANIHAAKFNEVQQYMNMTGHQYTPLPIAISEEFWQSLSPEMQGIVSESVKEASQFHRELTKVNDEKLAAELQEAGMEIIEPDREPFMEASQSVYKEYESVYGKEIINEIKADAEKQKQALNK